MSTTNECLLPDKGHVQDAELENLDPEIADDYVELRNVTLARPCRWRALAMIKVATILACQITAFCLIMPILPNIKTQFFSETTDCKQGIDMGKCSSIAAEVSGITDSLSAAGTAIMLPIYGSLSDRYGRKKPVLFMSCMNLIPPVALYLYVSAKLNLFVFFVLTVLSLGSRNGCISLLYASMADLCSAESRQRAFAGLTFTMMLAVALAPSIAISIQSRFGDAAVVGTTLVFSGIAFLTALVFDETLVHRNVEVRPVSLESPDEVEVVEVEHTFSFWRCKWPHVVDLRLACLVLALCDFSIGGMVEIVLFYVADHLHFTSRQNANMLLSIGITGVCVLCAITVGKSVLGDKTLVLIGLASNWIHLIGFAIAWNAPTMYIAEMIGGLSMLTLVGINSMISKRAKDTEQGTVFGILNSVTTVAQVFAPAFFGAVYAGSREKLPMAPFLVGAVFVGTALLLATRLKKNA